MKKKIIWVVTVAQSIGLFKGQLKWLSNYFDITVVASSKNSTANTLEEAAKNVIKGHDVFMAREISLLADIKALFTLICYFWKEKPDAIHGNTPKGGLLSMTAGWMCRVKTRIYMCHGLRYQGAVGAKRKLLMFMESMSCHLATHVLCVSEGVRQTLAKDGLCSLNKSKVIGYGSCSGIEPSLFNPDEYSSEDKKAIREKYSIKDDDFLFIYMGRIVKDKGVNEMIEAFTKLHETNSKIRLILLGRFEDSQNPVKPETAEVIRNNKNGVVYAGLQKDVKPFLAVSDCLVLASYREGFGMVLMEAGCMSLPVISSDIIGCNNVVDVKANGLLVEPKNADALYEKMKVMVENEDVIRYYRACTRKSIVERFDQKTLWKKFLEFYQSVI